ncbi:MAG: hypothetical protein JSV03_15290, partial [Planctomycetota bacterium]
MNVSRGVVILWVWAAVLVVHVLPATVNADMIYNFERVTNNAGLYLGSLMQVTVSSPGTGQVSFEFKNLAISYPDSFIAQAYFDDVDLVPLLSSPVITNAATVNFIVPSVPPVLPGGNTLTPAFEEDWVFGATPSLKDNGIHPFGVPDNDLVTITFQGDYGSVIDAIGSDDLRIGIHIQGL